MCWPVGERLQAYGIGEASGAARRCSSCRSGPAPALDAIADLTAEVKAMRAEFKTFSSQLQLLSDTSTGIKMQLTTPEGKLEGFDSRLVSVEGKAERMTLLEAELEASSKNVASLMARCNAQDQFSRLNNIEILGVPVSKGENLYSVVSDICAKVGASGAEVPCGGAEWAVCWSCSRAEHYRTARASSTKGRHPSSTACSSRTYHL